MKRVKKFKISKKKKLFFRKKAFFNYFFLFLVFLILFWFIFFSQFFRITKIDVLGNQELKKETISSFLEKQLSGKIYFLPKNNIFLVKILKIEKQLLEAFPRISKVELKLKPPNTLVCLLKEREAKAILVTDDKKFFLDEEGVIFDVFSQDFSLLPLIKSHFLPTNLHLNQKAIPKEIITSILKIHQSLTRELNLGIKEIEFFSEEKIHFLTEEGWKIFFKIGEEEWQVLKLKTLLKEELPREKREKLEYIDLRFENLAPYKFKS